MSKPMPSPNGTNYEGLTMPSPVAAYDAAPDDDDAGYSALVAFLKTKIDDYDMQKVRRFLGLDDDTESTGASDAAVRRNAYAATARDMHRAGYIDTRELERRIVSGPPRKTTAAEERAFHERFPHASRLK